VTSVTEHADRHAPSVRVRRYRASDATACCAVVTAAVSGMADVNEAARALITAHATPAALGSELASFYTIVALDGDRIVGLAALDADEIKRVYVHPAAQGRGVGRAMMARLERDARRRGLSAVRVVAGAAAATFYEHLRYARVSDGEHVAGTARVPFSTMRKALGAGPDGVRR
jgi:GNAT superfamily N-acetyltransferase